MIDWIKNRITGLFPQGVSEGTAELQKKKETEDLAYLAEKTQEKGALLLGMIEKGGAEMARRSLQERARKKVKKNLLAAYDIPEVVDQVTERLVDAALADPHYRGWFS